MPVVLPAFGTLAFEVAAAVTLVDEIADHGHVSEFDAGECLGQSQSLFEALRDGAKGQSAQVRQAAWHLAAYLERVWRYGLLPQTGDERGLYMTELVGAATRALLALPPAWTPSSTHPEQP